MKAVEATALAAGVRSGEFSATDVVERTLSTIQAADGELNSFTTVLTDRAFASATHIDALVAAGDDPGPLAGVPYAVKDLFDVSGRITMSGSTVNRTHSPAVADAAVITTLDRAGAILVGTLNMDEYACGFTTENAHYGPCRNPRDTSRVAGGSSGGSGAAVAGGLIPVALGSDTNGSVRVPAALCGTFGFKPTFGLLSTAGMEPYAPSFDHVGVLARTVADLEAVFAALVPTQRFAPARDDVRALRIAVLDDYFAAAGDPEVFDAVTDVAEALGAERRISLPGAAAARAAAMVMTAAQGAHLHLADLRRCPEEFDPMTRDRFIAGALLPATAYVTAEAFRSRYRATVMALFETVDILLAPTTPFSAPRIGQRHAVVAGTTVVPHLHLGVYTAPLSFIGLPVLSVPVLRSGKLPLGVQVIGAPGADAMVLAVAKLLDESEIGQSGGRAAAWT